MVLFINFSNTSVPTNKFLLPEIYFMKNIPTKLKEDCFFAYQYIKRVISMIKQLIINFLKKLSRMKWNNLTIHGYKLPENRVTYPKQAIDVILETKEEKKAAAVVKEVKIKDSAEFR